MSHYKITIDMSKEMLRRETIETKGLNEWTLGFN